jgi:ketosteroid isomerase-like protein
MANTKRLRQLNEQYIRAYLERDVQWFETRLADEFIHIESDGQLLDRQSFLQKIASGSNQSAYTLEDVQIQCFGETAVVRALGSWTTHDGAAGWSRYVDVYVRRDGVWKVVSAQITRPIQPA